MATSLLLSCGLNEQSQYPFIHISEESGADGSFLISSILGQRLRATNSGVILICLQHNFQHYLNAGMRLGYNLNMYKGKNLSVLDFISELGINFLNSNWFNLNKSLAEIILKHIEDEITKTFTNKSVNVIIDDLSILLNFEESKENLIKFVHLLRMKIVNNTRINVVIKLNNSELLDVIDSNLTTSSDFHVKVMKLKSGNFKEVDGKILLEQTTIEGDYCVNKTQKEILYKIHDKNIKVFNPGEIGVKI